MTTRPQQLTEAFKQLVDQHLADLVNLRATKMLEIEQFAELLHIHPTHLSNTIKDATGTSPCGIYQEKITQLLRALLTNPALSIKDIALALDFEPSQFTKWFRRFNGVSPKEFRQSKILKS
ncbi:helix-turn-helix transcriptional regulator [Mucilaginibacter corticis]|uniref:Helix-turn-helix transcriptional regulator n=1 Tax=Mucilaginibacter corticis TaxID=2597670 RepID=A0A556M9N0_9SPHI|nr:helix-turn-helix transcriptional regulator [Mucilaginibacter corticis]TSJ36603.1 helix-turn-helix transcriptional regulator [Mucilaginibacter corticis]